MLVRTRIIGSCARTLELPLLASSGILSLFFVCLGEEISKDIAQVLLSEFSR